ncbi:Ribokinase, partial [Dysosmobacter welbionis]
PQNLRFAWHHIGLKWAGRACPFHIFACGKTLGHATWREGRSILRQHTGEIHRLAVVPKPLQRIELPGLGGEHVDHHTAVVQQDPGAVPVALPAERILPRLLLHGLLHCAAQGVDLGVGIAGGNDEIVRQGGLLRDLDGGDVAALFLVQGFGRSQGHLFGCHGLILSDRLNLRHTCRSGYNNKPVIRGRGSAVGRTGVYRRRRLTIRRLGIRRLWGGSAALTCRRVSAAARELADHLSCTGVQDLPGAGIDDAAGLRVDQVSRVRIDAPRTGLRGSAGIRGLSVAGRPGRPAGLR